MSRWNDDEDGQEAEHLELQDILDEEPLDLTLEDEEDLAQEVCTCSINEDLPCPVHNTLEE